MQNLTTYLNDHLAGSVAALELIDRLVETYRGDPLGQFFKELRAEIAADQEQLEELIDRLGEKESAVRKAVAWIFEKLSRAKIQPGRSKKGELGLLQALEALLLGITGKRALWRALAAAAQNNPGLRKLDYARLEQRAIEQSEHFDAKRVEIARAALCT